jgi:hypothetical protein
MILLKLVATCMRLTSQQKPAGDYCRCLIGHRFELGLSAEAYAMAISCINQSDCPVLSIDVPSGLHADSGCVHGLCGKS